ncbi:hypothetical protein GQ457_16G014690 [Hibiscus cannabinus]
MIKRYCWKLFLSDRERPRKHQGTISAQIFSATAEGRGMYPQEGRNKVKVKDLKPKHIKDYLECKISQRSPALLKYHLFNDS